MKQVVVFFLVLTAIGIIWSVGSLWLHDRRVHMESEAQVVLNCLAFGYSHKFCGLAE